MSAKQLFYLGNFVSEVEALCEKHGIVPMLMHTDNATSLYTLVKTEKALSNMDFFVVDVRESYYSTEHIMQSLIACKNMPKFRTILITPNKVLAQLVVQMGIKDVIISEEKSLDMVWAELVDCLKSEKTFAQTAAIVQNGIKESVKDKVKLPNIPNGRILDIGVVGSCNRIGTTTQAIGLYNFFAQHGVPAVLVDHSKSLLKYSDMYSSYREENGFHFIEHIRLMPGEQNFNFKEEETSYKVRIHDLGVLSEETVDNTLSCDISILCCGSSVHEIVEYIDLMDKFNTAEYIKLFSFTSDKSFSEVCSEILNETDEAFCVPYMPEFLEANASELYKSFLVRKMKNKIAEWNS